MKVLLLQDVRGVGRKNDVIDAKDGYARNFLIAKKLAVPYQGQAVVIKAQSDKAEAIELKRFNEYAERLKAEPVVFRVKADEGGRVFGGINGETIEKKLAEMGMAGAKVKVAHHLKELGEHLVEVHFGRGVHGSARVILERE